MDCLIVNDFRKGCIMNDTTNTPIIVPAAMILAALACASAFAQSLQNTTQPPEGAVVEEPWYETGIDGEGLGETPVIRVYKDSNAWFGENRDHNTLLALGKVLGQDYFVHPLADLSEPIPEGTAVVLLTSNGYGLESAVAAQNAAAAQASLDAFVRAGGVLIVDMGDNVTDGGFMAPGAVGTPAYSFPSPCADATLAPAAFGPDAIPGTADDHPVVAGPDGLPGTSDDLDDSIIDMQGGCSVAHGNLHDGLTLPADATVLMTADFGGVPEPILAEYCLGGGLVVLDTITKEFRAHQGSEGTGTGPTFFMTNLFSHALSGTATERCPLAVGVDVRPRTCPNLIGSGDRSLPVAVAGTEDLDVELIDPSSVALAGVSPIGYTFKDVIAPHEPFLGKADCSDCGTEGADGFVDLILRFNHRTIIEAIRENFGPIENGDCLALPLDGELFTGRPILGEDVVVVVRLEK